MTDIVQRLRDLVHEGEALLATRVDPPPGFPVDAIVDAERHSAWSIRCSVALDAAFGIANPYLARFEQVVPAEPWHTPTARALGVLRGALKDAAARPSGEGR